MGWIWMEIPRDDRQKLEALPGEQRRLGFELEEA